VHKYDLTHASYNYDTVDCCFTLFKISDHTADYIVHAALHW